jgi:thioredoxin 1
MTTTTAIRLDDRGVIVTCPHCGQDNRLAYERLNLEPRCARCATTLEFPNQPIDVDNEELFEAVISRSSLPVLVDFWAPWCGPCKAIAPTLEELANELDGKLKIAKVNIDDNDAVAAEYGVRAIPTMILFKGGQVAETLVGMMPKSALKAKLATHVG